MFIDVLKQYHGDGVYLEAFAAACVMIWWLGRGKTDTGKKVLWSLGLAVLFLFHDLAYRLAGKLTDTTTYYRFFWLLPVVFLIAYVLTLGLSSRKLPLVLVSVALFMVCILVGGNLFLTKANLHKPENIYGLDSQVLAVSDAVMKDWKEKTGGEEAPIVAVDIYLEYQIRNYQPGLVWGISRKAYLDQAKHGYDYKHGRYRNQQRVIAAVNEGLQENARKLGQAIRKLDIDYLVIRSQFGMDAYLARIGIAPVADCGTYKVYAAEK